MTKAEISRSYPVPDNEQERLEALYAYDILDSAPESGFDRIVMLAARLFGAPIALVSLVDADRQWFKAKCGLAATETSRDFSFCTYAMLEAEPMVVCDATSDVRFCTNPLVTGDMSIRFYAGVSILSSKGLPLGTLCIIDTVVRDFPAPHLLDSLKDLSFLVGTQLEFRSAVAAKGLAEQRHQEALENARKHAEAANQAKSDFLARMSHEIRTPMNLIMGMNALLLDSPLNEKQRQHIQISYRNVRRLLRLINGILDLSKVEAGELSCQPVPFDLREVLSESAATISSAIERNGLGFEIVVEDGTGLYWLGDPEWLQQILLNLIGNSIKFTAKGKIEIRVGPETGLLGEVGLRFEVNDTGCGVPKNKAALIFDAFKQVEESMNRTYEGTGLGLSIAKTLVERMAGKIWVAEKEPPGAKFVFTVFVPPSTQEQVQKRVELESVSPQASSIEPGTKVLLAEDNPENVILMQAYMDNLSLAIDFASSGLEAVEKVRVGTYDLVLMDIQMPIMDGYTATREIRRWEMANDLAPVPIVALTAHALGGALTDSLNAGCNAHLTKPLERRHLLEAIAKHALRQSARVGSDAETEGGKEISELILSRRPIFLSKRRTDLERLREALHTANFSVIQGIGHNCKGIGKGYGFPEISRIGLSIETAAKAGDCEQIQQSIDRLEQHVIEASEAESRRVSKF